MRMSPQHIPSYLIVSDFNFLANRMRKKKWHQLKKNDADFTYQFGEIAEINH